MKRNSEIGMELYSTLEEAKEEIWKRWNDTALRKKVEAFVGDIPEPLKNEPRAWLDRYVATPDNEFFYFLELAKRVKLKPLAVESLEDRFYRHNVDKMCLGEMAFLNKENENSAHKAKVIDIKRSHMKRFKKIQTLWEENFVQFHHRLYDLYAEDVQRFDASDWFYSHGKTAQTYYPYLLSLFICHGILFEDFVTNEEEERFSHDVVFPAFEEITKRFGVRPLIVHIYTEEELSQQYCWCYPECVEKEVGKYV